MMVKIRNKNKSTKQKKQKQLAFTLIELLAVIIILGILMVIAVPSVTKYIADSRKSAYITTAKEITNGTSTLVNSGKLKIFDTGTTYYIATSYIHTENASKSPYGDFKQAYVGVTYDGKGFSYYWISADETGHGVDNIILIDNLEEEDIKSDINPEVIENIVKTTGIGNRSKICILNPTTGDCESHDADSHASEIGSDNSKIVYPENKDKTTLAIGDIVKIGDQEFYVMKYANDRLYLLARYNLYVGIVSNEHWVKQRDITSDEEGYGRQKSIAKGWSDNDEIMYGITPFSNEPYWNNKLGNDPWAYIYNDQSLIKKYVDNYANTLGITYKEARLMDYHEANELGCDTNCTTAPSFVIGKSYWLGNACGNNAVAIIADDGYYSCYGYANDYFFGVRPVIVI